MSKDDPKPGYLNRLWLRLLATAGIGAAIMLTWWWRIEDARAPEQIPAAAFGQPVDTGRSLVTPLSLSLRETPGQPGELVLSTRIENITGETQIAVFGTPANPPVLIVDGEPLDPPQIMLDRDGDHLQQLQPRIPEEVSLIWPAPSGWRPEKVEIRFARQTFKLRDNLYGQSSWLGFVPAARLTATPEIAP